MCCGVALAASWCPPPHHHLLPGGHQQHAAAVRSLLPDPNLELHHYLVLGVRFVVSAPNGCVIGWQAGAGWVGAG